jgi:ArsR family transcriptional regulator
MSSEMTSSNQSASLSFLSGDRFAEAAGYFALFSEPVRLRILLALCLSPGEMTVGELVKKSGINQPTVSRHLGRLLVAGVVGRRQFKNNAFYLLKDPFVKQMCEAVCKTIS